MISLVFLICLGLEVCNFEPGEFIVLKFDGPVTYSYNLKSGETREYKVENEEKIILENSKDSLDAKQTVLTYIRIGQDGVQLFPGRDKSMRADPDSSTNLVFTEPEVADYLNNASIQVKSKNEGPLNNYTPLSFIGSFSGVETHHKDFVCLDKEKGAEINADKKVPYKDCAYGTKNYTGEMVVTQYSKDDLVQKMAGSQNTMITGTPYAPLEILVKNTSFTAPQAGGTVEMIDKVSTASPAAEKGGCSSSLHPGAKARPNWGIFGTLVWVPAVLGLLRFRKPNCN